MIIQVLSGCLASLGFAYLFNIKGNRRFYASIGGGIATFVYLFSLSHQLTLALSMFLAALSLGLYCEIIARVKKAPVTLFLIVSLIPLVPGGGMYRMMLAILQQDIPMFSHYLLEILYSACALAIGAMVASSIVRVIYHVKGMLKHEKV